VRAVRRSPHTGRVVHRRASTPIVSASAHHCVTNRIGCTTIRRMVHTTLPLECECAVMDVVGSVPLPRPRRSTTAYDTHRTRATNSPCSYHPHRMSSATQACAFRTAIEDADFQRRSFVRISASPLATRPSARVFSVHDHCRLVARSERRSHIHCINSPARP
jgi:hypothetical protein